MYYNMYSKWLQKEYATTDTIMAYWYLSPIRIKFDLFSMVKTLLYTGKHRVLNSNLFP